MSALKIRDGGNSFLQNMEINLKSTKVDRQLQGLRNLLDSQARSRHSTVVTDSILSAVIENCLSSEGGEVRALAYRVLQHIYIHRGRPLRWPEVAATLALEIADLENANNKSVLAAIIGLISYLPNAELVQFFIDSGDGIKKSLYLLDPKMRYIATLGFGKLMVKIIQLFDESDFALEAHCQNCSKRRGDDGEGGSGAQFESLSEARRAREELFDLFREIVVVCSQTVSEEPVKVPMDDIDSKDNVLLEESYQSFEACCAVLFDIFSLYNSGQNALTAWSDALVGLRSGLNTWGHALRNQAMKLETSRLAAVCTRTLLKDNFILSDRKTQYQTSSVFSNLITQIFLMLLLEVPCEVSSVFTAFKVITPPVNDSIFAAKKQITDETEASRSNRSLLFQCLPLMREWVSSHLVPALEEVRLPATGTSSALDKHDQLVYRTLFELLSITQHPLLMDLRIKNAPVIARVVLDLLQRHETLDVHNFPMRHEVISWGLLVCRDLPIDSFVPVLAALLKQLLRDRDDVAVTRLITEAALLLIQRGGERPRTIASNQNAIALSYNNYVFTHLFEAGWLTQQLNASEAASSPTGAQQFRHRFVASVCRVFSRLLPDAVADVCRASANIILQDSKGEVLPHAELHKSKQSLFQLISASLLALKSCVKSLSWSTAGAHSTAAAVAYSNLLLQLALLLTPYLVTSTDTGASPTGALPKWAICAVPSPELELDLAGATVDATELQPLASQLADVLTLLFDCYFHKLPVNDASLQASVPCDDARKTLLRVLLLSLRCISLAPTKDRKEPRSLEEVAAKLLNSLQAELFLKAALESVQVPDAPSQSQSRSALSTSGQSSAVDFLLQISVSHPLESQLPDLVPSQCFYLELLDTLFILESGAELRQTYKCIFQTFQAVCDGRSAPLLKEGIASVLSISAELGALYLSHRLPYLLSLRQQVALVDRSLTSLLVTDPLAHSHVLQSPLYDSSGRPNLWQSQYSGFDFESWLHSVFRYRHESNVVSLSDAKTITFCLFSPEYMEVINSSAELKEEHAEQERASTRVLQLLLRLSAHQGCKHDGNMPFTSTSDVLSVIDDAILPHLPTVSTSNDQINEDSYAAVMQPIVSDFAPALSQYHERRWSQLSGSADMLVVHGCAHVDLISHTVRFYVRVVNSSGFKVPAFSLRVSLMCNLGSTVALSSSSHGRSKQSAEEGKLTDLAFAELQPDDPYALYFDDYFLPGAHVERELVFTLRGFGAFALLPRVVFEDVELEDPKSLYISQSSLPTKKSTAPDEEDANPAGPLTGRPKDSVTTETVALEFEPYPVGVIHQLLPYGCHTLTVHAASNPTLCPEGIPFSIFLSQWERLAACYKDKLRVRLNSKLKRVIDASVQGLAESRLAPLEKAALLRHRIVKFVSYSVQCAMAVPNAGPHEPLARLGTAARVSLSSSAHAALKPAAPTLASLSTNENETALLAWSMQTLQGDEVSLLVSLPPRALFESHFPSLNTPVDNRLGALTKNVTSVFDVGGKSTPKQSSSECWAEIRCSNVGTLKAVSDDFVSVIAVLSANSILVG